MEYALPRWTTSVGSTQHLASTRNSSRALQFRVSNFESKNLVRRAPADTKMGATEQGALRITGCSFKATEDDVAGFFDGYGCVAGSVKFKMDPETGRKKGECAVLFEDCNEAERACKEKQK
jgi:RNA recognition motif-containing protein